MGDADIKMATQEQRPTQKSLLCWIRISERDLIEQPGLIYFFLNSLKNGALAFLGTTIIFSFSLSPLLFKVHAYYGEINCLSRTGRKGG